MNSGGVAYTLCVPAPSKVDLPTPHANMLETNKLQAVNGDVAVADSPHGVSLILHRLRRHFL